MKVNTLEQDCAQLISAWHLLECARNLGKVKIAAKMKSEYLFSLLKNNTGKMGGLCWEESGVDELQDCKQWHQAYSALFVYF